MPDGNHQATCIWTGASGTNYKYWVYPIGRSLKPEGGNYVFCKRSPDVRWVPVYFGKTANLSERFGDHHAMQCIERNGATHIHARLNSRVQARLDEETDLRASYRTACNKQ